MSNRPAIRAPLVLAILGGLAALLLLELGLRAYWWPEPRPGRAWDTSSPAENLRWIPHPFKPYTGRANATIELRNNGAREQITTNAHGFRTHEFPTSKDPEDYFILTLGGSTTYGFKVDSNRNTWPERLEAQLAARYPTRNVRVFNLGVDMATSAVSLVNLALLGIHLQPDLVIVYHGYNDIDAMGSTSFRTDHAHFYRDLDIELATGGYQARLPRWMRASHLLTMLTAAMDMVSSINDLAFVARAPGFERNHPDRLHGIETTLTNLDSIHAIATSAGAATLFSTFQFRDAPHHPPLTRFNETLRAFYAERGYDYVDQDALLPDLDPTINVDPCHFTQKGRDLMAQHFFDHIVARGIE